MRCGTKSRESTTGCVPAAPTERCCSSSSEIVFDASRLFELNAQRERSVTVTAMNATAVEELVEPEYVVKRLQCSECGCTCDVERDLYEMWHEKPREHYWLCASCSD